MAQTFETYVSDGSQTIYTFSFDYLKQSFVKVLVDGTEVGFTLSGTYQVTLDAAPAAGAIVILRRETDTTRLVDFVDGSVLVAKDLNLSALQATHIAAEALDKASGSLLINDAGDYTAGFRRIADLADPVNPRDAVTKEWVETADTSTLGQTIAARDAAEGFRDEASGFRDEALSYRDASVAAAAAATSSSGYASTFADNAQQSANAASGSATSAASSASAAAATLAAFDAGLYMPVAGGTFTGSVVYQGGDPAAADGAVSGAGSVVTGTKPSAYFDVSTGGADGYLMQVSTGAMRFFVVPDGQTVGTLTATIGGAGTSAPEATTIITREKGDARFLRRDLDGVQSLATGTAVKVTSSAGLPTSGTVNLSVDDGNFQALNCDGALTLVAPGTTFQYTMLVSIANTASAGPVTLSGFALVTGDAIDTTSGSLFHIHITRAYGSTHAHVVKVI